MAAAATAKSTAATPPPPPPAPKPRPPRPPQLNSADALNAWAAMQAGAEADYARQLAGLLEATAAATHDNGEVLARELTRAAVALGQAAAADATEAGRKAADRAWHNVADPAVLAYLAEQGRIFDRFNTGNDALQGTFNAIRGEATAIISALRAADTTPPS